MAMDSCDTPDLLSWLTTLGDMVRLRTLRLLNQQELSVGELASILQLPQSTVSRHLKILSDSNWIVKRSAGTASLYRMSEQSIDAAALELWNTVKQSLGQTPSLLQDDARMSEVIANRHTDSKAFFGQIAGEWDSLRHQLFGDAFTCQALVSLINPDWIVADLGCGLGNVSKYLAPVVKKVIAIDREPAMLDAARKSLAAFDNIDFQQGDITKLPIKDQQVDAAIVFLVTVYLEQPVDAIKEVARILRPGGIVLIVDLVSHDRETYRHTMGHQHLGFNEKHLQDWQTQSGLKDLRYSRLRLDTASKGPNLFAATMRK